MDPKLMMLQFFATMNKDNQMAILRDLVFKAPMTPPKLIIELEGTFYVETESKLKIYCNHIKPKTESNKYIIFSHGNNCDIFTIYEHMVNFAEKFNINIICYDYPSYGASTQVALTEDLCYESHTTVINHVINNMNIPKENIILAGQSLGTGIVIDYISKNEWNNKVILFSPYKSISKVVLDNPLVDKIFAELKCFSFDSLSKAKNVKNHVVIFHGLNDSLISYESHAIPLKNAIENCTLIEVDSDHADILFKINDQDIIDALN